jgi:hypothetical protein
MLRNSRLEATVQARDERAAMSGQPAQEAENALPKLAVRSEPTFAPSRE